MGVRASGRGSFAVVTVMPLSMDEFRWRVGDDGKEMKGTIYPRNFWDDSEVACVKKREAG
jgi:hypothetical protein